MGDYILRGDNRPRHLSNGSDFAARYRNSLGRVNNVLFNQSLLECLIGAGDLLIESGGESGQQTFTDVRNPDRVQNSIPAAIDRLRNS